MEDAPPACFIEVEPIQIPVTIPKEVHVHAAIPSFNVLDADIQPERDAFVEWLVATKQGRGACDDITKSTMSSYCSIFSKTVKTLMVAAGTKSPQVAMQALNEVTQLNKVTSVLFMQKPGHHAPSPAGQKVLLGKLTTVITFFQTERLCELEGALAHCGKLSGSLSRAATRQRKAANMERERDGVGDIFGDKVPSELAFAERQALRESSHADLMLALQRGSDEPIMKPALLVTLAEALIPNRKEYLQHLRLSVPPEPTTETCLPSQERYYISFRSSKGAYVITMLQNKQGAMLAIEVPPELTTTLDMYFDAHVHDGDAIFSREADHTKPLADRQFNKLEALAYGGQSCVQKARHAVATHVQGVNEDLRQSYAAAMSSSARYLFGKRGDGAGPQLVPAYAAITKVSSAHAAIQHHRNMVFRQPFCGLFVVPSALNRRGGVASWEVGKIIATTPTVAKVVLLHLDEEDNESYFLPEDQSGVVVCKLPLTVATAAPLTGMRAPTKTASGWLIKKEHYKATVLAIEKERLQPTLVKETTAECMLDLEQGQLVTHGRAVAEVRRLEVTARRSELSPKVAILRYTQARTGALAPGATAEWELAHDAIITSVDRCEVGIIFDWTLTPRGSVITYA